MENTSLDVKVKGYSTHINEAKEWFERNFERIESLFKNKSLNDFIFEPFSDVFKIKDKTLDSDIYRVITQVALINAVLVALPGQMGVGVYVSMAFEAWMAYAIAKHLGINLLKPSDIFNYFGTVATVGFTIVFAFKHLLSFAMSLFSIIPFINPLIVAELVVTNFVGVLFWFGFKKVKNSGEFDISTTDIWRILSRTKQIFKFQYEGLKDTLNMDNIKLFAKRLKSYLSGELVVEQNRLNGDIFANAAMVYLLSGHHEKLEGPLGDTFIEAIRLRWSSQFDESSSVEDIAQRFREYDTEAIEGVINTIKGKMFEIMVTKAENSDNDEWTAIMHTDESFPGSDTVFTNENTGEELEVSLKAVSQNNTDIIEKALDRYPDLPIMTTDEAASLYEDNPNVFGSGINHSELHEVTSQNVDELINSISSTDTLSVVIGGVTVGVVAAMWPFLIAYMRKKISYDKLEEAMEKIAPEYGTMLVSRVSYALFLGPIFAWYLLARGVKMFTDSDNSINSSKRILLEYR